jgi:hypothetical protein
MTKTLQQHIDNGDFVKVEVVDNNGRHLRYVDGYVLDQNKDHVLMTDTLDLHYDGIVLIKKEHVAKFERRSPQRFLKHILRNEKVENTMFKRVQRTKWEIGTMEGFLEQAMRKDMTAILEAARGKDIMWQLGPIVKIGKKRLSIDHIDATGRYPLKPMSVKYKHVIWVKLDSPYANTFAKYAERVK